MPEWLKLSVFILICDVLVMVIVTLGSIFATGTEVNNLPLAIGLFSAAYLGLPFFLYLIVGDGPFWLTYLKILGYATALFVFCGSLVVLMFLFYGI